MQRIPRTNAGSSDLLAGTAYDRLASAIEANSRLTVAPPLMLDDTPAGKVLRIAPQNFRPIYNITGAATTPHVYVGNTWKLPTADIPSSQTTEVTSAQLGAAGTDTLYFLNDMEEGRSAGEPIQWDLLYSIGLGVLVLVTDACYVGTYGGKPLYLINRINFKNC